VKIVTSSRQVGACFGRTDETGCAQQKGQQLPFLQSVNGLSQDNSQPANFFF